MHSKLEYSVYFSHLVKEKNRHDLFHCVLIRRQILPRNIHRQFLLQPVGVACIKGQRFLHFRNGGQREREPYFGLLSLVWEEK